MIRTFDFFDLPIMHRYRSRGLCLDSTLALTWGTTMVPVAALLSYLAPATGIFTCLSTRINPDGNQEQPVLAQVIHTPHAAYARLSFLAPESALDSAALPELLDHLATLVGERGAHNIIAEVDENTLTFEALRKSGFAIYARQRIWKISHETEGKEKDTGIPWQAVSSQDEFDMRTLYNALVPALVHQVEPPSWERLRGLVFRQEGDLQAFVLLNYGPRGIMVQPFFHPDTDQITTRLADVLPAISNRLARTVYVHVRSYQSWLEAALEDMSAEPGPRQAVMVKRLAIPQKAARKVKIPGLEGTHPEITTPIVRGGEPV